MAGGSGVTPAFVFRRVMIFIDGGYLRDKVRAKFGSDSINFAQLVQTLLTHAQRKVDPVHLEIIRALYYDANVDHSKTEEHAKHEAYFQRIRDVDLYQVRLGRLIKAKDRFRQKGVDVLLAIDMITKAYQDHYDIAILLAGDDDFLDVVKGVKETGKRICGAFFAGASKRLVSEFDVRIPLDDVIESAIVP